MLNKLHRGIARRRPHVAALVAFALAGWTAAAPAALAPATWNADPVHTEVGFSITHFFTPVAGSFDDFQIDLAYDPEHPENSSIEAKIRVDSINTGNEKRDAHLRSADWFEAEKYPYITFRSTSVTPLGDNRLVARGPLTIKGRTQEIELPITLLGVQPIPEPMRPMLGGSEEVASFQASTAIERGDFGVGVGSWAGTMVVGSEVEIRILVEAHRP